MAHVRATGVEPEEQAEALLSAAGLAVRDVMLSILRQSCEQGVELNVASAVVLGVGAKGLRLALGPVEAARIVRQMADEVETDVQPAGRH
ncbi:hypothetical protein HNP73_000503 [Amaricoccus macauensis]|uniref:Uncharacterized protein n=1 Tax=Amaricoccus macauensis TaxID=57001 RepID=A0A840SML5_9RHOB|nr:hypothetical protein [Amaricoccus macauensis]MBB5220582.1 hypothetical protein [Amaricoccus macauensis]